MRLTGALSVRLSLGCLAGLVAGGAAGFSAVASAQPAPHQTSPERRTVSEQPWGPWLGPFRAKLVPSLMRDFGEQYLYAPVNAQLAPPSVDRPRVVFLGDSITDRWPISQSFPGRDYVNRGIGSQVTAQLVLRFHGDVLALQPRVVVLLAGVNDVQGFMQQPTTAQIEANFEAMDEMAHAHGVAVVFGSILPVNNYTPEAKSVVAERHPEQLRAINVWLKAYAASHGDQYADYYTAMADARGLMRAELTQDGVHPTALGYAVMTPIAQRAIDRALTKDHP